MDVDQHVEFNDESYTEEKPAFYDTLREINPGCVIFFESILDE